MTAAKKSKQCKVPMFVKSAAEMQQLLQLQIAISKVADYSRLSKDFNSPAYCREIERVVQENQAKQTARAISKLQRGKTLSNLGAAANRKKGDARRARIIKMWKSLTSVPERNRSTEIAEHLGLSLRYVRLVVKTEGLKQKGNISSTVQRHRF